MSVKDYTDEYDFDVPEDVNDSGGDYLNQPGWYQFKVRSVNEEPTNNKDEHLDGVELQLEVVAASVPFKKLYHSETFLDPSPTNKDGGKFLFKRLVRLARAMNLLNCHTQKPCLAMTPGDKFAVNWADSAGKSFVAKIKSRTYKTAKGEDRTIFEIDGHKLFWHEDEEVRDSGLKVDKSFFGKSEKQPKEEKTVPAEEPKKETAPVEDDINDLI